MTREKVFSYPRGQDRDKAGRSRGRESRVNHDDTMRWGQLGDVMTCGREALTVIAVRTLRPPLLLRLLVGSRLGLGFPLELLHLRPLILEPHLDHAHAKPGVLGEGLPHFSAGLRRHLEGRLKLTPLCRRENRPRPFWAPTTVPWSILVQ